MRSAPALLVAMTIASRKLTSRFLISRRIPSSNSCSKVANTSGAAFSISSSSTTLKGCFITWAVKLAGSSAPSAIRRDTSSGRTYSLRSIRTILPSPPKYTSAKALLNSVLPTPVGPRKRKVPIGRFWLRTPARARRKASLTTLTARVWLTIRWWMSASILSSRSRSSAVLATLIFTSIVCSMACCTDCFVTIPSSW